MNDELSEKYGLQVSIDQYVLRVGTWTATNSKTFVELTLRPTPKVFGRVVTHRHAQIKIDEEVWDIEAPKPWWRRLFRNN